MTIRDLKASAEQADPDACLTADQLAVLVRVTPETIRRLGRRGAIPSLKVGRTVRYPKAAALAAMARRIEAPVDA